MGSGCFLVEGLERAGLTMCIYMEDLMSIYIIKYFYYVLQYFYYVLQCLSSKCYLVISSWNPLSLTMYLDLIGTISLQWHYPLSNYP